MVLYWNISIYLYPHIHISKFPCISLQVFVPISIWTSVLAHNKTETTTNNKTIFINLLKWISVHFFTASEIISYGFVKWCERFKCFDWFNRCCPVTVHKFCPVTVHKFCLICEHVDIRSLKWPNTVFCLPHSKLPKMGQFHFDSAMRELGKDSSKL